MYRLYTSEEIDKHFGDRGYFKEMTRDQIKHVFQYLAKMSNQDYQVLEDLLLKDGLCELQDAAVYKTLQGLSPQVDMFGKDYFKKTTSKIAQLYKKMCKYNKYNFKQKIGDVLDMGQEDGLYLALLKKEMFARFVSGVSLDKNKIDQDPQILNKLMRFRDDQIDIIVCNSSLHSVDESLLGTIYDQFARIANKFIILKDYALGENFHLMKEMAIQREIGSGIGIPSDIPDLIANDPDQILDPSMFYNMEFSIERGVRYLKEKGFSVVYEPPMPKSMGNVRIYVLKKDSFIPMTMEAANTGKWAFGNGRKVEGIQDLRDTIKQQSILLNKKAIAQPTRDKHQREVTVLLNKLSASNYESVGSLICESFANSIAIFKELLQDAASPDAVQQVQVRLEEFFQNITDRLFNRARTCRLIPEVFASIYNDIVHTELDVSGITIDKSRIYILMQERCSQYLHTFFNLNVALTDPEILQEMRCHAECIAKFIAHSRLIDAFDHDIYNIIVRQLIEYVTPYPELIITLLEQLQATPQGRDIARAPSHILYIMRSSITQNRAKCLILNYIDQYKIDQPPVLAQPTAALFNHPPIQVCHQHLRISEDIEEEKEEKKDSR